MSVADAPEPLPVPEAPLAHGLRIEGAPATQQASDDWAEENFFRVVLNLEGGDWVEVATFPDEETAEGCARDLVAQLADRAWPRVRSRYLRPETILSVEVSERRRYTGSAARRGWGDAA
jgi:hypothetical protein